MTAREDIAASASTVDGITVLPYYVQTTQVGTGMVRLDRTDYPDRFGGLDTWQVIVVLPDDVAAAETYIEEKLPLLVAALRFELAVRWAEPRELVLKDGPNLPVLIVAGQRESE